MRTITVKYQGNCGKCGAVLGVGTEASYERMTGIFCPGCEPTDPEEIRAYRQERADRKADRYEGWAKKREEKAVAQLNSNPEMRHDWAFITQPGHIPARVRMNRRDDKAHESLHVARGMRDKAQSLRKVRVAGDAEAKRQAQRDSIRSKLQVGMTVDTGIYGTGVVDKINRKTATIKNTGTSRTYKTTVDLSFLSIIN